MTVDLENRSGIYNVSSIQVAGKVPLRMASKILTVGPDYRNHRGGIGAVIEAYSRNFETFNFICTHKEGSVLSKSGIFFVALIKLFFKLATKRKIKIIHIHGASSGSFYRKFIIFFIGKYLFGKKIIYHIHGGGFEEFYKKSNTLSQKLIRFYLSRARAIICISLSWRDYFQKNYKIKKLFVLPNMVDYPEKDHKKEIYAYTTFIFLGLVTESKGVFDLVNVIAENKDKYRNRIKLLIGGNGKIEKLTNLINEYEISDIVEYLGWVTGNDKSKILNKADVYILPSYVEGSPVSILEAMAYGMPIISTNVGGIPELVKNNENGLLIEPGNLKQIEKAIDWFVMNPEFIKTYGAVSELIVQKYLPASVVKQLIEVYQSVLSPA